MCVCVMGRLNVYLFVCDGESDFGKIGWAFLSNKIREKKKLHLSPANLIFSNWYCLSPAYVKFYYEYLFEVWSIVLNKNLIEQLEVF